MSPPSEILLCRYNYDPLDRLIGQSLVSLPECQRFYCKSRLATEVQGAITFSLLQSGDQLLAQRRRQDQTLDVTLLATDQQRSVLCTVHADAFPAIAYSPYGYRIAENGVTSLLGFNGERRDLLTGHYLLGNGYRAFNPVLMRFNSADSLSPFEKGGLNSYAYCLGDPINNSDPTGQFILPSRVKAMVSGWVAKAKMNLSLEVGKKYHTNILFDRPLLKIWELPRMLVALDLPQGRNICGVRQGGTFKNLALRIINTAPV